MLIKLRLWCLLCVVALSASCAVRTQVVKISDDELRQNVYYENIIFKKFAISDTLQKTPQIEGAVAECESSAIGALQGKNVFKTVKKDNGSIPPGKNIIVENTLIDLRIVSGAARFWGGAMAGRSHMKVHVKLIDATTNKVVHEEELMGAPNAMGSAYSAGTSDQRLPVMMGLLMSDYISANSLKK